MNDNPKKGVAGILAAIAMTLPAGGALAQTVPVPQEGPRTIPGLVIATPTPAPARTPVPVPTGPVLGLPGRGATMSSEPRVVRATRPRTAAPERTVEAAPRTPSATPSPADRATPETAPTVAAPTVAAVPVPAPTAAPSATPTPAATVMPIDQGRGGWPWLTIGAGLIVVLALVAWAAFRRRALGKAEVEPFDPIRVAPPASSSSAPSPPMPLPPASLPPASLPPVSPPPAPTGPRARIDIALRPLRAGLNMLSAVVEAEVVVTNVGDAPAAQVRINATLLSAHAGQEADLATTFAAPPTSRPAAPPFALEAGEERRVRVVAALSREAVRSMDAGGRPMFVPLVAIDVRYAADAGGTPGQTGQAFVVGVERVDSAKLAPFWLDAPLRMYDQIAARVQGHPRFD